jgi:L-serine/L-threonine ammonia-lyase
MSLVAKEAKEKSADAHLIIASGGNAGYAAACAAKAVGIRCTVYLPAGLHPRFLDNLKKEGAEIVVEGKDYSEALAKAEEAVAKDEKRYERTFMAEYCSKASSVSWSPHMVLEVSLT